MASSIPPRRTRTSHARRKKRRIWPWFLLFFCFVLAAVAGALFASSSLLDKPVGDTASDGLLKVKDKTTIMIMGDDDVDRSDTLMIATIDPKKDQAALLSIPRDTRVKIKGHGYDKINAAYAYGGHKLTESTVEGLLGVDVEHYIMINTKSFQKIIDAIGGIDIDVEKRMYYEDPWDDDGGLVINLRPGMQHMDGKTAMTYVRFRDEEGDIGRIKRQQKFMKACMDKLVSPSIIPKLPTVITEVMDSIKTDLSMRQLLEFAGTLKSAQKNGLKTEMVPGRPLYIDGVSYWIPNISELRTTLAETLGIPMNAAIRKHLDSIASEYENSIPSNATEVPASDTAIGRSTGSQSTHKSGLKSSKDSESRSSDSSRKSTRRSSESPADTSDTGSTRSQPASSDPQNAAPSRGGSVGKSQ